MTSEYIGMMRFVIICVCVCEIVICVVIDSCVVGMMRFVIIICVCERRCDLCLIDSCADFVGENRGVCDRMVFKVEVDD